MDGCHHYGQKQEGACQLHDPHKTEQEILAGYEREREGREDSSRSLPPSFSALPFNDPAHSLLHLIYAAKVQRHWRNGREGERGEEKKRQKRKAACIALQQQQPRLRLLDPGVLNDPAVYLGGAREPMRLRC